MTRTIWADLDEPGGADSEADVHLREYVCGLRAEVEPHFVYIDPTGREIIEQWLSEMYTAALNGNATAVKRLSALVQRQLDLESAKRTREDALAI